nr:uncharacterized protein LOC107454508 isoform X1 [Parasteatoda tepidariorum]
MQIIERPFTIDRPAITLCDANRRSRRHVCTEQPHKCVFLNSEEELCSKHDKYCNLDDIYLGVFKDNPVCDDSCYDWQRTITEFEDFITHLNDNNILHLFRDKRTYKLHLVPFTDNDGESAICLSYGLKSDVEVVTKFFNRAVVRRDLNKDNWQNETKVVTTKDIVFVLHIKLDEYLDPLAKPAIYLTIHDSRKLVNPFRHGLRLGFPGYHLLQITEYIEQHLLPDPYDTNCSVLNKGTSDEFFDIMDCIESCNFNLHMEQYGCAPRSISISHMAKLCKKSERLLERNRNICLRKCSNNPCVSRSFKYKHLENINDEDSFVDYHERKFLYPGLYNVTRFVYIAVSFKRAKARIITFVPKMEPIDLFSNIGGFLGIWIGSSIISVSDFLYKLSEYVYIYTIKLVKRLKARIEQP